MAYLLKMAIIETIRTLHHRGWSQRRIAGELGINRETVARYLRQADSQPKPATAPTGSQGIDDPLERVIATPASIPDRPAVARRQPSGCEPWRDAIQAKCDLGLTAQRIYQDLVTDHGFAGSYYSVRRFVRRLEQSHELPFRRIECDPGDEAQIDFGTGAPVVGPDGKRRRTHVLRVVLSHSRKGYSEAVYRVTPRNGQNCTLRVWVVRDDG